MALNAWTRQLGVSQGRIEPTGSIATNGDFVFCLGADRANEWATLAAGDYMRVVQTGTITALAFLRSTIRVRAYDFAPGVTGLSWRVSVLVDGVEVSGTDIQPGGVDRVITDLVADLTGLSGNHEIGFQLKLVGAAGVYDVELPGVYVDAIVLDSSTTPRPTVVNRDPGPGDIGVARDGLLRLRIVDPGGGTIHVGATHVYIGTDPSALTEAFNGTIIMPGFDDPGSGATASGDHLDLVFAPTSALEQGIRLLIRVVSQVTGSPSNAVDVTYSFTVEDALGPSIAKAAAIGRRRIRVEIDGDVLSVDATRTGDALNPASWGITLPLDERQTRLPSVTVSIVGVELVELEKANVPTEFAVVADRVPASLALAHRRIVPGSLRIQQVGGADLRDDGDGRFNGFDGSSDVAHVGEVDYDLGEVRIAVLDANTTATASYDYVSAVAFDVITNIEMTARATYELTANVVDEEGNAAELPESATLVVGFQPDVPAGRDADLFEWLPQTSKDEDDGDLAKFMGCLTEVEEQLLFDRDAFQDELDPDTASEAVVDLMLIGLGNPFKFELALIDKRRLIRILVPLMQQFGTDDGIVNAMRFFLGVEVSIVVPAQSYAGLGVAQLGLNFILVTTDPNYLYNMNIVFPRALTAKERTMADQIAKIVKRPDVHHFLIEPTEAPADTRFVLGTSQLGLSSTLSG